MNLFEVYAKLFMDSSEYESKMEEMKSKTESTAGGFKTAFLGATAAGAAALGAFGVSAVKTTAEFDASMSQVAATMGKSVDEIQNLREFALEMGSTTAFSASQAADALNYMALAGYDAETSMNMLPNVLNLAAAGGMELADASDMITDSQSALGLTLEETSTLIDQMAMASSRTNTSVSQMGSAILTVGGTAKMLSGGTQELNQVLGILADNGIKGAEGGTHLRNILLQLPGAMESIGYSAYDADGNLLSLQETFTKLGEITSDMTEGEKTDLLSNLFNVTDISSVNALLATNSERWQEVSDAIGDATGAAEQMGETQLDNLEGDITLLKSAFEGLQISVGDSLMPVVREFVQFLTTLVENMDTVGPVVLGAAAAFGTFAIAINIGGIIEKVTIAFKALSLVLTANPIGLIVAAVVGLGVALVTLWNTNEGFRAKVIEIWEAIKGAFLGAWEAIKGAWETAQEFFQGIWDGIQAVFATVVEVLSGFFSAAWDAICAVWDIVVSYFENVWNGIQIVFSVVADVLTAFFSAAWAGIEAVWGVVVAFFENVWNGIKIIFSVVKDVLGGNFSDAWEKIKSIFSGWGDYFSGLWEKVKAPFANAASWFYDIGANIVNGIKQGIADLWDGLVTSVTSKVNALKAKFTGKSGFDTNSPSKWSKGVFRNVVEGAIIGWEDEFPALASSMGDGVQSLKDSMDIGSSSLAFSGAVGLAGNGSQLAMMQMMGALSGNKPNASTVVLEIDGRKFAQATYSYYQNEDTRRGVSLVGR